MADNDERVAQPEGYTATVTGFFGQRLGDALRAAAAWIDDHYFDGEPQTILIDHCERDEDAEFDEYGGPWLVRIVADR